MKIKNIAFVSSLTLLFAISCGYDQPYFNPQRFDDLIEKEQEPCIEEEEEPVVVPDVDPTDASKWELVWSDEFDYHDALLDNKWIVQNSDVNTTIACGRWRENCLVSDGTLKLMNKGPKAGYPSPYTSGNVWTKDKFEYGYFECRYRYAGAHVTNNSFWIMSTGNPQNFEIDINEGHYPNEVATNTINHSSNPQVRTPKDHYMGVSHAYSYKMKVSPVTTKIRFSAVNRGKKFHIPEFRIYNVNAAGYPDPASNSADTDIVGLINYAKTATITSSGSYSGYSHNALVDGNTSVHWIPQEDGDKWVEFSWDSPHKIGCIQFLNGWLSGGDWIELLPDFKLEYYNGTEWKPLKVFDAEESVNFATDYHIYSVDWNANEIIYYFDRKEIRHIPNVFCPGMAPVWLSEAILPWRGDLIDSEIIGTQMEVDYVRIYKHK